MLKLVEVDLTKLRAFMWDVCGGGGGGHWYMDIGYFPIFYMFRGVQKPEST